MHRILLSITLKNITLRNFVRLWLLTFYYFKIQILSTQKVALKIRIQLAIPWLCRHFEFLVVKMLRWGMPTTFYDFNTAGFRFLAQKISSNLKNLKWKSNLKKKSDKNENYSKRFSLFNCKIFLIRRWLF